jgi:hypothetical protein
MLGLSQFGLLPQDCLGEFFEAPEQDLQLSILEGGGSIQGRRFRREFHIDGFTVGLIGDFEVGPVALGRVGGTGALGFAALHRPLQYRPFAEVLQLIETSFEFVEALRVAFQVGSSGTWHYSYGNNTVGI